MKVIVLLVLIMLTVASYSQVEEQKRIFYQRKIESFHRLQNIGTAVGVVGICGIIAGAVITSDANKKTDDDDVGSIFESLGQYFWGQIILYLGGAMFIGGTTMHVIGFVKSKQYQKKLTIGIIYNGNTTGLRLVYRF